MKNLVALHWVSPYPIRPLKIWLILDFFQDLVYQLLEHSTNYLSYSRYRMPHKISSRSVVIVFVRPKIPSDLRDHLSLPLSLLLVLLNPLILINAIHEPTYTPDRFPVKDFFRSCLTGKPTLKVLIATSSKFPSILLNISQYLSEYVFKVSPSRIAMDNKESKGRRTLLQVTKRAPNARVSFLKELIEPSFRLINHLIAIGPKLNGNTLHIRASLLECTTIIWLKWLTCSMGSVPPLYRVNVG